MIGLLITSALSTAQYSLVEGALYISGDGNVTSEEVNKVCPKKDLISIVIQDQVRVINANSFYSFTKLVTVDATPVTHIQDSAFSKCSELKTIIFGENLEFIGDQSFFGCIKVEFDKFPDALRHIGELSFYNCDSLPIIKISKTLTFIGPAAFADCLLYNKFEIDSENPQFAVGKDGAMYNKNLTQLFLYPSGNNNTEPKFEPTINYIRTCAFRGQNFLDRMIIPDSVTRLGDSACDNMHEIIEVSIPGTIKKLPFGCFKFCDMLEQVHLNEGLFEIGACCFQLTHISIATLPNSVAIIGTSAFQSTRLSLSQ